MKPLTMATPAASLSHAKPPLAALVGVLLLISLVCVRAMAGYDPFPAWSGDPVQMEAPIVGITPVCGVGLDCLTLLAAVLILFGLGSRGIVSPLWQGLCLLAGAVPVFLHARVIDHGSMENLILGSAWLGAMTGAYAGLVAARDPVLRRLIIAALLGLIVALAVKGAVQVYIDQPDMMQAYAANRERILNAQGWSEGSAMALAYERRISQPEATGWFGLSNVFSTLAAGSLVALAGMLVGALRTTILEKRNQTLALLGVGVAAATAGVYLSHSKGGVTAAVLGLGLVFIAQIGHAYVPARRHAAVGILIAVAAVCAALAAIVLRGFIGERMGELSLLFRWFYMKAAVDIFSAHPLLGTGPAGFKDGYMLLKPAASPEDVSSPHSIFLDFAATLGVGGLLWGAVLWANIVSAGRDLIPPLEAALAPKDESFTIREEVRMLLIAFGASTAGAALLEHAAATIDSTLERVAGLAGLVVVSVGVLRVMRYDPSVSRWGNPAIAAAAIAVAAHAQIELTGVTPGASAWLFLLLAVAGARPAEAPVPTPAHRYIGGLIPLALLGVLMPAALLPVWQWETLLRRAAHTVEVVPHLAERGRALSASRPQPGDSMKALTADLGAALGSNVSPSAIPSALVQLRYSLSQAALIDLLAASAIQPQDYQTTRAASNLLLALAGLDKSRDHITEANAQAGAAEALAVNYVQARRPRPAVLAWLASVQRVRYEIDGDLHHLEAAVATLEEGVRLAPHEPLYLFQLCRLETALGHPAKAASWARRALVVNQEIHLDPLRQYSAADLAELNLTIALEPPPP